MSTAAEWKGYVEGWRKRLNREKKERAERQRLALERAQLIARALKEKYAVERVVLFGSVAKGRVWHHSDIDLAVFGVDIDRWLDMAWDADELAHPFRVDLVPFAVAPAKLQEVIEREGVMLKC